METLPEKFITFLSGGGIGGAFLLAVWYFLQRQEKRETAHDQHEHEELAETRRRADAFGDEMYDRWLKCQAASGRWKNAYVDLYYKGQGLLPWVGEMPPQAVSVAQQILDAPPPGKIEE